MQSCMLSVPKRPLVVVRCEGRPLYYQPKCIKELNSPERSGYDEDSCRSQSSSGSRVIPNRPVTACITADLCQLLPKSSHGGWYALFLKS